MALMLHAATDTVVCGRLQTLNEDYFAVLDLQQADLPGVRTPLDFRVAT
jgi:hypothetical protein